MNPKIDILLATFNGEKFLEEQLASLANQTLSDFHVLISDGGSSDRTLEIARRWVEQDPRFELLPYAGRLGVKENFSRLMMTTTADYLFLADQDDVWKPEKLSSLMQEMERLENKYGKELPLLVHSDLTVVNEKLEEIAPSFWKFIHLDPLKGRRFSRLLLQNTVTGAACLINRPLLAAACPIPKEAVMHDWWLALTAITFGRIGVVQEQTVFYRQHGNNELGAKPYFSIRLLEIALWLLIRGPDKEKALKYDSQVKVFSEKYASHLSLEQKEVLAGYFSLSNAPFWKRLPLGIKYKFYHCGFLRNVAFLCFSRQ